MITNIKRSLTIPGDSFFLFGPRGVGKSTWLANKLKPEVSINLLKHDVFLDYLKNPSKLRDICEPLKKDSWVTIDEVQKIPALLDEVHYLIEEKKLKFALSGSSARKLKRSSANLLAGRAITKRMDPFSFAELKDKYQIEKRLQFGNLPLVFNKPLLSKEILKTYVSTYLKEEIQEEGHLRKIEPFVRFLEVSAMLNGMQLNSSNLSREAGVSRSSVDNYFSILTDTLIGYFLPAYQVRAKVKEQAHPKFYWFDSGVARAAAGLIDDSLESEWMGRSLETLLFHELRAYNNVTGKDRQIAYYSVHSGGEIDFIIELQKATLSRKAKVVLIEVKYSKKWNMKWNKSMCDFKDSSKTEVVGMYGVYMGSEKLKKSDVNILPILDFLENLHSGKLF